MRINETDAIARLINYPESVDLDVIGIFNIDPICRHGILRVDHHVISCGDEDDRIRSCGIGPAIESGIIAILYPDGIAGGDVV